MCARQKFLVIHSHLPLYLNAPTLPISLAPHHPEPEELSRLLLAHLPLFSEAFFPAMAFQCPVNSPFDCLLLGKLIKKAHASFFLVL
jgi:hypothetical protein